MIRDRHVQNVGFEPVNGSQLKNPDISGAIFTSSLSIRILNSQCEDGARDVRVLLLTPVTNEPLV